MLCARWCGPTQWLRHTTRTDLETVPLATSPRSQAGAKEAISILGTEFEKTMGSAGCRTVDEVSRDIPAKPPV